MAENLESKVHIISKKKLPENIKEKIRNFANNIGILYGPIKITKVKEFEHHYLMNIVLYSCVADEQGGQNYGYDNVRVTKKTRKPAYVA